MRVSSRYFEVFRGRSVGCRGGSESSGYLFHVHGERMTKAKATEVAAPVQELALESSKLKKLIIKNFRCIGRTPVEIELDDIVVLVGPNNAGKSTILRAYEVVMNQPSSDGNLKLEDFPNEKVDPQALPEIELQTYVREDRAADVWLHLDAENGKRFVRERWTWEGAGPPRRQGFKVGATDWDDHAPWGWSAVARARRPQPQRIDAFARPRGAGEEDR